MSYVSLAAIVEKVRREVSTWDASVFQAIFDAKAKTLTSSDAHLIAAYRQFEDWLNSIQDQGVRLAVVESICTWGLVNPSFTGPSGGKNHQRLIAVCEAIGQDQALANFIWGELRKVRATRASRDPAVIARNQMIEDRLSKGATIWCCIVLGDERFAEIRAAQRDIILHKVPNAPGGSLTSWPIIACGLNLADDLGPTFGYTGEADVPSMIKMKEYMLEKKKEKDVKTEAAKAQAARSAGPSSRPNVNFSSMPSQPATQTGPKAPTFSMPSQSSAPKQADPSLYANIFKGVGSFLPG